MLNSHDWLALFGCASLVLGSAASAHHSFSMFDRAKTVTVNGTIKEVQWTNPHVWIQVMAPDESGKAVEYSVECPSPILLDRQGWKKGALKAGDKVAIAFHPLRDGSPGGSLALVTATDGTQFRAGPRN